MNTGDAGFDPGAIAVDQAALTLLMLPPGEEPSIGGHVLVAGYDWDDPADKAGYARWQLATLATVLRMCRRIRAADRAGRPRPPLLPAPPKPRQPHLSGATSLMAEPVLLIGDETGADAELGDILSERVTLFNAPPALVDLAMSVTPGPNFDDPVAVAALQVWAASAQAEGEWYSTFYGALVDPSVVYADHCGSRRATLRWTALEWAGIIELPYGEYAAVEPNDATLSLSGTSDIPPPVPARYSLTG